MADVIEPIQTYPNPLRDLHERAGAEFQPYGAVEIVSTFGEPQAEYAAFHRSAALIDEPQRGILEVTGDDRLMFLNNMLTNQAWDKAKKSGLAEGQGVYAFFLNGKGRIISDAFVIELGDKTWLGMDARKVDEVQRGLGKFLFREAVTMTPRVNELRSLALHGPGAIAILSELARASMVELPQAGSIKARLFDADVVIWRDDACGAPGFHLVAETGSIEKLWTGLVSKYYQNQEPAHRRLHPAGWAAFNACRIEAGRPIFGIDFDEQTVPAETGQLDRAVSFTKGCYLGQEIVARMRARDQVAKQIVGLRVADDALPVAGTLLYDDADNEVGGITSSTVSPVLSNACICLGQVKKPFIPVGSVVKVPAEGAMRQATVAKLPFLNVGRLEGI